MTCGHLSSPTVVIMPTWSSSVVCLECMPLVPPASELESRTCDRCEQVGDLVHPVVVNAGPSFVVGGVCDDCYDAETKYLSPEASQ